MDIEQELEKTFKIPTALIAFLAIVIGILVLFFPYILNILIAFFLIVYGLMKAFELGSRPSQQPKTTEPPTVQISDTQTSREPTEEESSNLDVSDIAQID